VGTATVPCSDCIGARRLRWQRVRRKRCVGRRNDVDFANDNDETAHVISARIFTSHILSPDVFSSGVWHPTGRFYDEWVSPRSR
jgi:hypothetical protein